MSSRRVLKAAPSDPGSRQHGDHYRPERSSEFEDVTVTLVEVSADMRQAKVNVSIMGDEKKQRLCLHGLQNSAGYLQNKVGNRIDTKYTPRIEFVLDKGMQNAMVVTKILEEVLPQRTRRKRNRNQFRQHHGTARRYLVRVPSVPTRAKPVRGLI